jgi:hypothetical protein
MAVGSALAFFIGMKKLATQAFRKTAFKAAVVVVLLLSR